MVVEIGKMRHCLSVWVNQKIRDEGGGYLDDWQDAGLPPCWGDMRVLRSGQTIADRQRQNSETVKIRARYRADIAAGHRLYHAADETAYEVTSVIDPDGTKRVTEIMAVKV